MGLPAPKNIIADPHSGVVTPEWLAWFQQIADNVDRITPAPETPLTPPPAVPGGGLGGGPISIFNNYGSGTPGVITKWLAPQQLGDSLMSEAGGAVTVNGPVIATSFQGTLPLHYLSGFPGGTTMFLRADGTFAIPPSSGGGGPHAPTHEVGGGDTVDVTALGGFTGSTTEFLRADGNFAVPAGGGGGAPAAHHATHEPGGSDALQLTAANRLFGRGDSGSGAIQEIAVGTGLVMDGTTLAAIGRTTGASSWTYNNTTTEPPTGSQVRFNAAYPYTAVSKVWIRDLTNDGIDMHNVLLMQASGSRLYLQDKDDHSRWVQFETTAEPVAKTGYVEFEVTHVGDGGVALPEQQMEVVFASGATDAGVGMDLDYLGTYPAAPVYNDGDIVVGPDNVLYMCVVDGTTTPPEPWPGIGMATAVGPQGPQGPPGADAAIVADATYWTVSSHPTLVNERALNALANGYVKSTAGEPSTVAVIPVTEGGTSATNATNARTNLGVGNVGTLNLSGSAAQYLRGDGAWATPVTIPSGLIAIFMTACPVGWTRMSGWDGRFPRGNIPAGAGGMAGSTQHYHLAGALVTPAHAHGASGLTLPWHDHGGVVGVSGSTSSGGSHTHSIGIHQETSVDTRGQMNADAGTNGFVSLGAHKHNFDYDGSTGSAGDHSHSFSGSGAIPGDGGQGIEGVTANSAALAVGGNTDWATDHYPPFVDVVYCMKD